MTGLTRRRFLAAAAAVPFLPASGLAQEQVVRLVFPAAAGGSADTIARALAASLGSRLARSVIVENRTGAGGSIGVKSVIQSEADGSTLLFATGPMITLQPHLFKAADYDPLAELAPVTQIAQSELAIAVARDVPVHSLDQLAGFAKSDPARAFYGSPGSGTSSHFTVAEFARRRGLELRHVPYRGSGAAMPDVLAGRTPIYVAATPELSAFHKDGRLRIIATTGAERSTQLPDVATLKEQGTDLAVNIWYGVYAPSKTPSAFVTRLQEALVSLVKTGEVKERIESLGFQPTGTSAEQLRQLQTDESRLWKSVVQATGFTPEQ